MIGWILGLLGVGGVAAILFFPPAQLLALGIFRSLMAIPIPLLIVMVGLAVLAIPTMMKVAGLKHDLRVSEKLAVKVTGERDLARTDLKSCQASVTNLNTALDTQSAAVAQLGKERDAAIARGNAAVKRANEVNRKWSSKIRRLQAGHPSSDFCASARSLAIETLGEDR